MMFSHPFLSIFSFSWQCHEIERFRSAEYRRACSSGEARKRECEETNTKRQPQTSDIKRKTLISTLNFQLSTLNSIANVNASNMLSSNEQYFHAP